MKSGAIVLMLDLVLWRRLMDGPAVPVRPLVALRQEEVKGSGSFILPGGTLVGKALAT
jgi:hypothetical protein